MYDIKTGECIPINTHRHAAYYSTVKWLYEYDNGSYLRMQDVAKVFREIEHDIAPVSRWKHPPMGAPRRNVFLTLTEAQEQQRFYDDLEKQLGRYIN